MNRAEELISNLEAEIVKRDARIEWFKEDREKWAPEILRKDARIAELEVSNAELRDRKNSIVVLQNEIAALKEQQRGGVVPGSVIPDRDGLVAAVCVLRSQGLGNLADSVSDALAALDIAHLNPPGECVAVPTRSAIELALNEASGSLRSEIMVSEPLYWISLSEAERAISSLLAHKQ